MRLFSFLLWRGIPLERVMKQKATWILLQWQKASQVKTNKQRLLLQPIVARTRSQEPVINY